MMSKRLHHDFDFAKCAGSVHAFLKTRARQNRRSVNQEAIAVFEEVLAPKKAGRAAEVAQIVARNRELRGRMSRFLTDEEIKAAKEEGRL